MEMDRGISGMNSRFSGRIVRWMRLRLSRDGRGGIGREGSVGDRRGVRREEQGKARGKGYKQTIHYKEGFLWTLRDLDLVGLWTLSFKTHFGCRYIVDITSRKGVVLL